MVPPNGVSFARSTSTWIHWWSPVTSANVSTSFWVTSCQSEVPSVSPSACLSSSSPVIVRMAGHHTSRRAGPAFAVRHARATLPRLLLRAGQGQGRGGAAGQRAARLGQPGAVVRGQVPAARGGHVLRAGVGGLSRRGLPRLPRGAPGDAGRPGVAVEARAGPLPRARLGGARPRVAGGGRPDGLARRRGGRGRWAGADPHRGPRHVPVRVGL